MPKSVAFATIGKDYVRGIVDEKDERRLSNFSEARSEPPVELTSDCSYERQAKCVIWIPLPYVSAMKTAKAGSSTIALSAGVMLLGILISQMRK